MTTENQEALTAERALPARTASSFLAEIDAIDKLIDANRRTVMARVRFMPQTAHEWQNAWEHCPDLWKRDHDLFSRRGLLQEAHGHAVNKEWQRQQRRDRAALRRESKEPSDWSLTLAADINNQFELGLSDRALRSLAFVIARRAVSALDRSRARSTLGFGAPQAAGTGCNCPHEVRSGCSDPNCIHSAVGDREGDAARSERA